MLGRFRGAAGRARMWCLGLAWISPWIVGTILFLVVPVAMSVYYSLTDYSLLDKPVFVGLANYAEMAHDVVVWKALREHWRLRGVLPGAGVGAVGADRVTLEQRGCGWSGLVRADCASAHAGSRWCRRPSGGCGCTTGSMGCSTRAWRRLGSRGSDWLGDLRWCVAFSLVVMKACDRVDRHVVICSAPRLCEMCRKSSTRRLTLTG